MRPLIRRRAPRPDPAGRDPAPSRLAYRLERLWLTPVFRAFVRIGLPAFALVLAVGAFVADDARRAAILAGAAEIRRGIEDRPEFMVRLMAIDGATPAVADGIRKMLPLRLPESSFRLNLEAMRTAIARIDAVERVDLRIRPGGVLQIDILERTPAILWRIGERVEMLDVAGHRVATLVDRAARPDLPLIAGRDADAHVAEALAIFTAAGPLGGRIRGLSRIGERRWDVILDRDQKIMLPETDAAAAFERLVALNEAQDLFGRDVVLADLRDEDRPTIRLAAPAAEDLRKARERVTKVSGP
ncbi:MAG: cell division protein FtsQ/DivIB [Paracoccaceae bacterium]